MEIPQEVKIDQITRRRRRRRRAISKQERMSAME